MITVKNGSVCVRDFGIGVRKTIGSTFENLDLWIQETSTCIGLSIVEEII